jgi:hypothetical protein
LVVAAIDIWWVMTYRHGYPFDVDEAGYTTFGLIDYLGLKGGGLHAWWEAIQAQGTYAPLVPALTSLVLVIKPSVLDGFAVLTAFLVVLTMASYGIGERLAGPRLGALAALVTATIPGAFAFAREYIFALPVAALLACAVYALLRSDGLRVRRWAIACGIAVGLMLLARTMAIAYVPGLLVAALVALSARRQGDLFSRFVNLGLLVVAAVAVSATWYVRNLRSVVDYLTNYGYGSQSKYYGGGHSLISWSRLHTVAEHMTTEDLYVPLAALLVMGLGAMAAVVVKGLLPAETRRAVLRRIVATDALSVAIVFVLGYAALTSSQNGGDGFTFPLAILLPPLAVLALRRFPRATAPAVAMLVLVSGFNVISTSDIWPGAAHTRLVSVPGFDEALPVTKGTPHAVYAIRLQAPGPESRFVDRDEGWLKADRAVSRLLATFYGPEGQPPLVAFASRNRVISSNTVQLAMVQTYHTAIPFSQLSAEPNDSIATYIDQLSKPAFGRPSTLITMSRNTDDFPPLVTQSYAEAAARRLGFRKVRTMHLPDGRLLRVWRKQAS